MKKLLIFIVCYNHEQFIERVINRIPDSLLCDENLQTEILIIDDQSKDNTFNKAVEYANCHENLKITVLYNPVNQGYGGNQKIGYYYAIQNNFDAVVLLHGDGQYAPEFLPKMVQPIFSDQADVVLGSRMVHKSEALKGKMPLYKWLGNQFLTTTQNFLLKSNLSEFHTGYRAFRVSALKTIPYDCNSNYYDFDTEILIQLLDTKFRITDTPIPTYYGDEISYVNSVTYGFLILWATVLSRLVKLGILYNPKFSYEDSNTQYLLKLGFPSSHQFAIDSVPQGATLIDAGCGPGYMARELRKKGCKVISIDQSIQELARQSSYKTIEADIDKFDFCSINEKVDVVFLLDIIEHLKSPEQVLMNIREAYCFYSPQVIITTGNIAFFPLRVFLMLGQFNYGKRGILDFTHTRLFTIKSLRRAVVQAGYRITKIEGIPAPFPHALGDHWLARTLTRLNSLMIRISKSMFSYQIAVVCQPLPTLTMLLNQAQLTAEQKSKTENQN